MQVVAAEDARDLEPGADADRAERRREQAHVRELEPRRRAGRDVPQAQAAQVRAQLARAVVVGGERGAGIEEDGKLGALVDGGLGGQRAAGERDGDRLGQKAGARLGAAERERGDERDPQVDPSASFAFIFLSSSSNDFSLMILWNWER